MVQSDYCLDQTLLVDLAAEVSVKVELKSVDGSCLLPAYLSDLHRVIVIQNDRDLFLAGSFINYSRIDPCVVLVNLDQLSGLNLRLPSREHIKKTRHDVALIVTELIVPVAGRQLFRSEVE